MTLMTPKLPDTASEALGSSRNEPGFFDNRSGCQCVPSGRSLFNKRSGERSRECKPVSCFFRVIREIVVPRAACGMMRPRMIYPRQSPHVNPFSSQ
jgi:hypothetical protein